MKGAQGFQHYYGDLFADRWPALVEAMHGSPSYLSLTEGLLQPYHIDIASAVAASVLPIPEEAQVLDMCAAPGGKTLVLARRLASAGAEATLVANERSSSRRARLHRVLEQHLPESLRDRVRVTGFDARKWGLHEQEAYDAILCDVPCSSERHLVESPAHLERWSPNRIKSLSAQSVAFLAAACDAARPGGHVLYSTCALTEQENDAVVARVLKRRTFMRVVSPESLRPSGIPEAVASSTEVPRGEVLSYGRHILPDREGGSGPLYYALLRKDLHSSAP